MLGLRFWNLQFVLEPFYTGGFEGFQQFVLKPFYTGCQDSNFFFRAFMGAKLDISLVITSIRLNTDFWGWYMAGTCLIYIDGYKTGMKVVSPQVPPS